MKRTDKIDAISEHLKTALSKSWDSQTREYLTSMLDMMNTAGDGISGSYAQAVKARAEAFLGTGLEEAARRPVLQATEQAYANGKTMAALDFALKAPDLNAISTLQKYSFFWVGRTYDRFVSQDVHALINDYFKQGHKRSDLADALAVLLHDVETPKVHEYFSLLSDHLAMKISSIGHVAGYEDAGVEYVEVVAVLDSRTSPICRHMHGRVIAVNTMTRQRDAIMSAASGGDMEAIKRAQPMISGKREKELLNITKTSGLTSAGIALPPYHFRCRTTTVAHFKPADYADQARQWIIDGEVPRGELPKIIDNARTAKWGTHKTTLRQREGGNDRAHPTFMAHAIKHGKNDMKIPPSEYNQRAVDLIRRGNRDAFMVITDKANPEPKIYFHDPDTREVVIVKLKWNEISSFFRLKPGRDVKKLFAKSDVIMPLAVRGVQKWIPTIKNYGP